MNEAKQKQRTTTREPYHMTRANPNFLFRSFAATPKRPSHPDDGTTTPTTASILSHPPTLVAGMKPFKDGFQIISQKNWSLIQIEDVLVSAVSVFQKEKDT